MEIRKVLTVMLCTLIIAAVFAVAVPRNVGAADPVTIYIDTFWIDQRTDLTPEQRQQLKDCLTNDIQRNFNLAVGAGKVEVTNDSTKKAGSDRQIFLRNTVGTHTEPDGSTGHHYGEWIGGTEVTVYLGSFMDLTWQAQNPNDYKTGGQWDITKLNNAIGQTCAHELGHSFCIGHNGETAPENQSKMTNGALVPSLVKANNAWIFDEHSERVLAENLNKTACNSTTDYDEMALCAYFWGDPDLPGVPDEWGAIDALLSFSGPLASDFELGWYGVDTDNGVYDGSSEFDFIYKTSMLPDPEQNAEMLTFFEGITDKVQFLLRGAPGSLWEGHWFPLNNTNVALEDFIVTPNDDVVARKVSMGWDVDGEPGLDVQIILDAANAFGSYTSPYNGFTYEYVSAPDIAITNVVPSKTVVGQGYSLNISVTIENRSDYTGIIVVVPIYANTTIIETKFTLLSSGGSAIITFTWNTAGFAKGKYTISVSAWSLSGGGTHPAHLTDGDVQVAILCDVNGDGSVDMADISLMIDWFMTSPPNWNPNCDVNDDLTIDMADIASAIDNFMKTE